MKYLVYEIQKNHDGSVAQLVTEKDNILAAESVYHQILAAAALSTLACHSAVILNDEGGYVMGGGYQHPAPETVEEPTAGDPLLEG